MKRVRIESVELRGARLGAGRARLMVVTLDQAPADQGGSLKFQLAIRPPAIEDAIAIRRKYVLNYISSQLQPLPHAVEDDSIAPRRQHAAFEQQVDRIVEKFFSLIDVAVRRAQEDEREVVEPAKFAAMRLLLLPYDVAGERIAVDGWHFIALAAAPCAAQKQSP